VQGSTGRRDQPSRQRSGGARSIASLHSALRTSARHSRRHTRAQVLDGPATRTGLQIRASTLTAHLRPSLPSGRSPLSPRIGH
jgi:hypothetical protein